VTFREQILERDGRCLVCGKFDELHPHHIHTRGAGGDDSLENGITLCAFCHDRAHRGIIETPIIKIREIVPDTLRAILQLAYDYDYAVPLWNGDIDIARFVRKQYTFEPGEIW
jgi:hypothetical protein